MSKIVGLLLLTACFAFHPGASRAADGHENLCSVVNVGYNPGVMTVICASGSINMAVLAGSSSAGTCPTVNMDDLKILTSQALAARASGLVLTIWWTDSCFQGSQTYRAITGIEVKGN